MKILFLVGAASRIRHFHNSIMELADRGHVVTLAGRLRKGSFELPKTVLHERVSGRVNPTVRVDDWRDAVDLLRGARDYLRYFDPRFGQATRLVRRAYQSAPTDFALFCERRRWVKRHWRAASRALALGETLLPTDPGFEAFLREERPDLVLVTPLVTFESYQTDYVKAAHRLGVPVAFIPFSWDNLTNKGLMRIPPDRVLVWNDVQRREAIELHGCRPERVVVTGAARFDDFFDRAPATSRAEFFAEHGLDPARPMVVWLGSSQLTGPNEMELVRRWAESLRASTDEAVRTCGVLIRPHPALRGSWASVDMSDLPQTSVFLQASRDADQVLYDSLHHAHAAVGLNTSAMLEAAIVGRPVHTLVMPGFDEGQIGTMHFHYLVEAYGGLATVARDFAEHARQLAEVLVGTPIVSARSRAFAAQFLRPHGIDRPASPILTVEIEKAAAIVKRPRPRTPVWHHPLRAALRAVLGRREAERRGVEDTSVIATALPLRGVRTALQEIQQGNAPVLVGPWADSIANEVLYWIPFVRWVSATYGLAPERLIIVSRAGASEWYGSLARRYLDARTLFSPQELQHWERRTVPQSEQDPHQGVLAPFDQAIVERASLAFDLSEHDLLHPFKLFSVLQRLSRDRALAQAAAVLRHARFEAAGHSSLAGLPKRFVAVSLAFTPALPDTPENRRFLGELVARTAAEADVVIVDGLPPGPIEVPFSDRVHFLERPNDEGDRLRLQTQAVAQARGFIGGYGDLAVLAAFCGTPVQAYRSARLPEDQPGRLHAATQSAGWGHVVIRRARHFRGVRLRRKAHAL